jgi:hypothetical protein
MAGQTLAAADAILKELYVAPIVEQLNQKKYLLEQIERDSDHIEHTGRKAVVPVHKNRNWGQRSLGDGGTLPTAGKQEWADALIPIRAHTLAIELTDMSIEATKNDKGAFISLLTAETQGAAVDLSKNMNRQAFGKAGKEDTSGSLCAFESVKSTGKSAKITFANESDVQYLQVGMIVDVIKESNGKTESLGVKSSEITTRSVANKEVELSVEVEGEVKTSSKFNVYFAGSRNNEIDGLRVITNKARELHSINSASAGNAYWDGNVISAAGGAAGEDLFEQLADNVGAQGNGEVEVFLTSRGIKRRLANTYQSQKRFNDKTATQLNGGYSAIMVNEVPVVSDDDCPKGFAFGINKSAFKWFQQTDPGWLQQGNAGIFHLKHGVSNSGEFINTWIAFFRWYAALGCVAPNRTGRIEKAADDAPF